MKWEKICCAGGLMVAFSVMGCDRNGPAEESEATPPAQRAAEPVQGAVEPERAREDEDQMGRADKAENARAKADIESAEGKEIEGEALFTQTADGVRIVVNVEDAPAGPKGIHIHEKGDCSDIAGQSMGKHFAPEGDKHGLPSAEPQASRHLGDLGNIDIGSDGVGKLDMTVTGANLKQGDKMSFLGKAIIIHESKDLGASKQPSGGSGAPMACGVIEAS